MEPLKWPEFYNPEPYEPKTFLERLPLIGWWFSQAGIDYEPVINNVKEQLIARPKQSIEIWGQDTKRQQMAQWVCEAIKAEYKWPNDHFIPNDPFEIVLQMPWDDLQVVEFLMLIEEELEFSVNEKDVPWDGTLGEFVDFLISEQNRQLLNS